MSEEKTYALKLVNLEREGKMRAYLITETDGEDGKKGYRYKKYHLCKDNEHWWCCGEGVNKAESIDDLAALLAISMHYEQFSYDMPDVNEFRKLIIQDEW